MKKLAFVVSCSLLVLSLNACTLHKTTDAAQVCDQAKRQAAFDATNPSHLNSHNLTASQQAKNATAANC